MKKNSKQFLDILFRYLILVVIALPNFWIFYFVFTPLTIYPVYFLINLFFDSFLIENVIVAQGIAIELIPACIAGSAYYLLSILNLSTANIKPIKRTKMIFLSFVLFLILNVLRIFLLSVMAFTGSSWFDITHITFWYAISTIFVVGIWFFEAKKFKIKEIPFYSDVKFLYEAARKK